MLNMLRRSTQACSVPFRYCQHISCDSECLTFPATKVSVIPNGVRVVTEESNSALACISLVVEAGSRFETPINNGITHVIEHMAFKGLKSLNRSAFEQNIEFLGANMHATTSRELQFFTTRCHPDCAPNVVEFYSKILSELELSDHEFESEKYNICLELIDTDNNPKAVLFDYLHQTAFQGTPLSQPVIGPSGNIQRFDRQVIAKFISDHYQPQRFVLASSGYLCHEDMVNYVQHNFGNFKANLNSAQDNGPYRFTGSEVIYRDDSMPFAHVAMAFEVPGYNSEDHLICMLAAAVMGSWDKSQGGDIRSGYPLARAASVANLCESYEMFYIPYRDTGLWGIYFVADKMSLEDMMYNIQTQFMNLANTTTPSDLVRGVNALKLKLAKSVEGSVNSCIDAGTQISYLGDRMSLGALFDRLACAKMHNVREFGLKYLYDQCPAVAAVGPTENLPDYTRIRAGQYWLRY